MSLTKTSEPNTFDKYLPWLAFAFVLLIYLTFPTKNYYWDGIEFASVIEDAKSLNTSLLHPNHLFYNTIGYLGFKAAQIFNPSIRAIYVLQFLNSLFSVSALIVLFFILKKLSKQVYPSLFLSLLFAFSATWWKFSTDASSYIPSILFLLISFYLILSEQKSRSLAVAITHSLAMFFHQLALFFFPVIVLGIILQNPSVDLRKRVLAALKYSFASFALTFGTFCFSFYLLTGHFDLREFFRWVTWFSAENGFVFDAGKSFLLSVRGTTRLFFDGRFNFVEFNALTISLLVLLSLAFCLFIFKLLQNRSVFGKICKSLTDKRFYRNSAFVLCAVWIAIYLLFLFFFIPGNAFYRLFYLPAIIFILSLLISKSADLENHTRQWRLALLAFIIFATNFLVFIQPYSKIRSETPLSLTMEMNKRWSDKTIVFYDSYNSDNRLVKYFNPTTTWVKLNSISELEAETKKVYSAGGNVWIETSAIEKLSSTKLIKEQLPVNLIEKDQVELKNKSYYLKFIQIVPRDLENKPL